MWPTQVTVLAYVNRYFYYCGQRRPVFLLTQASVVADAGKYLYCCGRRRPEFLLLWPVEYALAHTPIQHHHISSSYLIVDEQGDALPTENQNLMFQSVGGPYAPSKYRFRTTDWFCTILSIHRCLNQVRAIFYMITPIQRSRQRSYRCTSASTIEFLCLFFILVDSIIWTDAQDAVLVASY